MRWPRSQPPPPGERRAAGRRRFARLLAPGHRLAWWVRGLVARGPKSYAKYRMDLALAPLLGDRPGVFVEAGANDGVTQSNTLRLELEHGWTGILVEPIPSLYRECKANRPACIVEQCALVAGDFQEATIEVHDADLYSTVKGFRTQAEEDEHLAIGRAVQHMRETRVVRVPATTVSALLDKHGIRQVDLFSLDVEGFEEHVLRGIDFRRHRPRFILVEGGDRPGIQDLLRPLYEMLPRPSPADSLYRLRDANWSSSHAADDLERFGEGAPDLRSTHPG